MASSPLALSQSAVSLVAWAAPVETVALSVINVEKIARNIRISISQRMVDHRMAKTIAQLHKSGEGVERSPSRRRQAALLRIVGNVLNHRIKVLDHHIHRTRHLPV